jgi:hypothetical protein
MDRHDEINSKGLKVSRRFALKHCASIGAGAVLACVAATPSDAGWGACSKCSCKAFVADYRNDRVCATCGDGYGDHW